MKAMVLAAGFGTRLQPLTRLLPKPMFPVMNRPLLAHTLELLRASDIRDITVNVHHLPDKVIEFFGDGSDLGVRLNFSREEKILGTAGGIKRARKFLEGGPFFVINSDILVNIDLNRVFAFHRQKGACLTLVVRQDTAPEKYDPIEIAEDGRIVRFPGASSRNPSDHTTRVMFTGIQIMQPEIFDRIPSGQFYGTTESVFPEMIREGLPVYAFLHKDYWIDMGTRESYLQAHADALAGKVNLKSAPSNEHKGPLIVPPVLIGRNCRIAQNVQIGPCAVLGNGCQVKQGSVVENSVCWEGAILGSDSTLRRSIIASGVTVPDGEKVVDQSLA